MKRDPFPPLASQREIDRDPVTPTNVALAIAYGIALGLLLFSGVR